MTPNGDEQKQAREEKIRRYNKSQFQYRWLWTALFGFNLTFAVWNTIERRAQWHYVFPMPDYAQFTHVNSLAWAVFGVVVWTVCLVQVWHQVGLYRRDEEKLAQEQALADANRQREGVWPPAPTKPE